MDVEERAKATIGAERWETLRRVGHWIIRSYVVVILLGIIVGLQIAPVVGNLTSAPTTGNVAVIPLQGGINGGNALSVTERLARARQDPDIKAVVLRVNSGGGSAPASEQIYMAVKRTAQEMPVVASVNSIAASGAYYAAVPADAIYVKPTSFVGSIGVFFVAPAEQPPINVLIQTGPNKLSGADRREWEYKVESARRAFVGAVTSNRGQALTLTPQEISYAKLYMGAEAVDNGLADRIGSLQDAIERAAEMAGLARFGMEVIGYSGTVTFVTKTAYVASDAEEKRLVSPAYFVERPGTTAVPNLLMLPPTVVQVAIDDYRRGANTTEVNTTRVVPVE